MNQHPSAVAHRPLQLHIISGLISVFSFISLSLVMYCLQTIGDNQNTNNEVVIDSEAVNVVTGGQMESKFTASYIQFGLYQLRRTADNGLAFKVKEG